MAGDLEELLDLLQETGMVHWLGQLDVSEMARALCHACVTGRTLEASVDGSEARVVESLVAWLHLAFVHRLGV